MAYRAQLDQMIEKVRTNPEHILPLHYVYQFNLDEEAPFQLRFDKGTVEVLEGTPLTADCTLLLSPINFNKLMRNELNAMMAFMLGSLKVNGRMGLALKLHDVLKQYQ
jgi:putative sterol carrier protein